MRLLHVAPWATFCGTAATLLGLAWIARLHTLDPTLAMREGVFVLDNPAHVLFTVGLGLVVAGTVVLLLGSGRRRTVTVLASAALVVLAVVTFAAAVSGQGGSGGHDHGAMGPAATPEQRAAAARLLADVKAGIAPYATVGAALAAGYRQTTPWRFLTWGPAHFTNPAFNRDGRTLDPAVPETLVYMRLPRGGTVLIGAMFVAPRGTGPRPGGPLTEWHTHDNLCVRADGRVALATGPGQCPPGSFFLGAAVEMMHIWTFDNPDGPFAHSLSAQAIGALLRQFGGR